MAIRDGRKCPAARGDPTPAAAEISTIESSLRFEEQPTEVEPPCP
jgi:hypothetical protein